MMTSKRKEVRVLYVGHLFPHHLTSKILNQRFPPIQTQRFGLALLTAIARGFIGEVEVLSVAPLLDYPICKTLISPKAKWIPLDGIHATMIPFINIIGLKHLTRFLGTCIFVGKWSLTNSQYNRIIIMHGIQSCKVWGVIIGQAFYPAITLSYLTDDIGISQQWEGRLIKFLRKVDVSIMKAGLKKISGVISMTNRLAESLAKSRPSLILPSIQNVSFYMPKRAYKNTNDGVSKNRIITIVYAGGLYKDSGVDLLAESFCRANWNDKRLIIAGSGILENTIRAYSKKNARISFLGFLDANKLIELYAQADILINPRRISSSIALLSFPSKIVEYLCTGKPVISTNMPSLTAEFRKQLILVYSEEPEELIQCIDRVASWDSRKRNQWRISTIQFIKRELSPDVQGSRIKEFVQGL